MSTLQAIVLGVVQGLTEFLPISSSGHLRVVPAVLGWEDPGAAFTAVTQLGTMLAVLLFFRMDLLRILVATGRSVTGDRWRSADPDARCGWLIAVGTIPIGVVGLLLRSVVEDSARDLYVIGTALVVFSAVMLRAEASGTQTRELDSLTARDGMLIGTMQAVALIPGVSRSGSTISAGLLVGLRRSDAARFSFLLSVPAVVLSGAFELRDVGSADGAVAGTGATVIATIMAFVVGYASIALLLRFVAQHSISVFCTYRVAVGALVLVLAATGAVR